MFTMKRVESDTGFSAALKLPRYFPKEEILGKAVYDSELKRVGQAVDWTYTPSGIIMLIVSRFKLKEMPKGGDSILVPFNDIERVGDFILLSKPMDALLPKEVATGREELETAAEVKFAKAAQKNGKKKKSINELGKEVIDNLIPEVSDTERKPQP